MPREQRFIILKVNIIPKQKQYRLDTKRNQR